MPVWAAILMAMAATVMINLGFVLQKQGAVRAASEKAAGQSGALVRIRVWRLGIAVMVAGWGLYFAAVKFAPISIVQPALGAGLAVLALFSVFYLKEKITLIEWVALVGMIIGIALLGLSSIEESTAKLPDGFKLLVITGGILLLTILAYLLGKRGRLGGFRTDSLLGIVSGLFIGLGAIYLRSMFLFVDNDQKLLGYGICLPVLVIAYVLGLGVMQSGFQHGKALIVVALEAVSNKVIAIFGGMFALAEYLPQNRTLAIMRVIAFVLLLSGSGVLSRFGGKEVAEKISSPQA